MNSIHWLVVLEETGSRKYALDSLIYSIGRDPHCDIPLSDRFVSRYHATLLQVAQEKGWIQYRIMDGNYQFVDGVLTGQPSTNGLVVNGRKVSMHDLQDGDEIVIGHVRAVYYTRTQHSWEDEPPPDPNSYIPRQPHPLVPDFGAEALPDAGFSRIP